MWYIYALEYYSAIKKNEIMPFAATWMDLEITIRSEVSHTEKDKYDVTHMWNLIFKKIPMNLFIYQEQIYRYQKQTCHQKGNMAGEG